MFFITNGQLPSWINLNASKLVWIKHQEYIPAEYLPTFSANPIELSLHRISELSEKFVYFNDDFFLLKPIQKSHFFKNGLPVLNPKTSFTVPKNGKDQFPHLMLNNVMLINSHFDARSVIMGNMRKFCIGRCHGKAREGIRGFNRQPFTPLPACRKRKNEYNIK